MWINKKKTIRQIYTNDRLNFHQALHTNWTKMERFQGCINRKYSEKITHKHTPKSSVRRNHKPPSPTTIGCTSVGMAAVGFSLRVKWNWEFRNCCDAPEVHSKTTHTKLRIGISNTFSRSPRTRPSLCFTRIPTTPSFASLRLLHPHCNRPWGDHLRFC